MVVVDPVVDAIPAVRGEEGGEGIGAHADDGHVLGFEVLLGAADVEDRLAAALMTPTLVRPNSSRSAETSIDSSPPLLTPPMPPVAMNRMPAIDAHRKIAAIVKPALSPFTMA